MWLFSMELAENEIIAYILLGRKVISFSVNRRNQTSFLAEGNIGDFLDPGHLVKTISLFSPRTLFFRPPIRIEVLAYEGLCRIYEKVKMVEGCQ